MYSKSTYRPRRTRLYGASYDIGESYYKRALDNLDNKNKTIRFSDAPIQNSDHSFLNREGRGKSTDITFPQLSTRKLYFDEDDDERHNVSFRAVTEDPFIKLPSRKFQDILQDDSTFTSKRASALQRVPRTGREELHGRNDLNSFLEESASNSFQKKSFVNDEYLKKSVIQKTRNFGVDEDFADSSASLRAKATKARLANLESEMMQISEKQTEREKRNLNLKKLLTESDSDEFNLNKAIL